MKACVNYLTIKEVEFTDEDMREAGYEGEITDEMREEYLYNLIDEDNLGMKEFDDREVYIYK